MQSFPHPLSGFRPAHVECVHFLDMTVTYGFYRVSIREDISCVARTKRALDKHYQQQHYYNLGVVVITVSLTRFRISVETHLWVSL